jgi:nucleoside-diphosphate-sugar epimerase
MNVLLIGATGYIGRVVAQHLAAAGHRVRGVARSDAAAARLAQAGLEACRGDMRDPSSISAYVPWADAVINAAFEVAWNGATTESGAAAELGRTRAVLRALSIERTFTSALIDTLAGTGKRLIVTTGTALLGDTGTRVRDEDEPVVTPSVLAPRFELERQVLASAARGVASIVIRPPTTYGRGGSTLLPFLLRVARETRASCLVAGTADNRWSVVHVDDLADLYVRALDAAPAGSLFHGSAEVGVTTREIAVAVSLAAGLNGVTREIASHEAERLFGVWAQAWSTNNQTSGEKARRVLGWRPVHLSIAGHIYELIGQSF